MDKGIIFSFVARGVLVLLMLAVFKLITIKLSVEDVGKWSLLIMTINLFSMSLINPVCMYLNRHFHYWMDAGVLIKIMRLIYVYYLFVALFSVVMFYIWMSITNMYWGFDIVWLLLLVALGVLVNNLNMNSIYYINMMGLRKSWFFLSVASVLFGVTFSLYFISQENSVENWMFGQYLGYFLVAIVTLGVIEGSIRDKEAQLKTDNDTLNIKSILQFSVPLFMAVGLYWVQFQSFRIFIAENFDLVYLGLFVAGYTVSSGIMGSFESVLQQYYHPAFYKLVNEFSNDNTDKKALEEILTVWGKLFNISVPLIILTALTVAFMSKPLLHLLVDQKYWNGWYFVVLGALVEMCRVIGNVYGLAFHAIKKTKMLLIPHFIGAIFIIISMPICIMLFRESGIAISMILSSMVYLYVLKSMIMNKLKVNLNLGCEYYYLILFTIYMLFIDYVYLNFEYSIIHDLFAFVLCGILYILIAAKIAKKSDLLSA